MREQNPVVICAIFLATYSQNIQFSSSQFIQFGKCPNPPAIENLDLEKYIGTWYEIERYPYLLFTTVRCITVNYTNLTEDKRKFTVTGSFIEGFTNTRTAINGWDTHTSREGSGELEYDVVIDFLPRKYQLNFPFKILGLNYSSYAVKWWCTQAGLFHYQGAMILSRIKPPIPEETQKAINHAFIKNGLRHTRLVRSNWEGCDEEGDTFNPMRERALGRFFDDLLRRWRILRSYFV